MTGAPLALLLLLAAAGDSPAVDASTRAAATPVLLTLRDGSGDTLHGRRVAVRGRLRLVGSSRDLRYVVTTTDEVDVTLEVERAEHGRLEPLQGRRVEATGTFEVRPIRYPDPAYDRTDYHLYPDGVAPALAAPPPAEAPR